MTFSEKEVILNRIASGYTIYDIDGHRYKLYSPTNELKYLASVVYKEVYDRAYLEEALTSDELMDVMIQHGLWSREEAERLDKLIKELDDLKVKLYDSAFKSNERRAIRKSIEITQKNISKLELKKSKFDFLTCEGIANFAKTNFIIGMSLTAENGDRHWQAAKCFSVPDNIIDKVIEKSSQIAISETCYRKIARSEPWRSVWMAGRAENQIFGVPATELTIEQKTLLFWSHVYENIRDNHNCPHESIIDDDLMLDGWIIKQQREREADQKKKVGEELISSNKKIQNASEVFIPVDTIEDARALSEAMNSPEALAIKRQRFAEIEKRGHVNEMELPDIKKRYIMEFNKKYGEHISGHR